MGLPSKCMWLRAGAGQGLRVINAMIGDADRRERHLQGVGESFHEKRVFKLIPETRAGISWLQGG